MKRGEIFWIKSDGKVVKEKNLNFNKFFESGKLLVQYDGKRLWIWKFWHRDTEIRINPRSKYFVYLEGKQLKALKDILAGRYSRKKKIKNAGEK